MNHAPVAEKSTVKKTIACLAIAGLLASCAAVAIAADKKPEKKDEKAPAALDFKMKSLKGEEVKLSTYKGKVVLMVNVASKCGLTKQYTKLEALHEKYNEKGLAVLGFPANEFGGQEPGTDAEIAEFCSSTYDVKFDMFSKVVVKGDGQCPLYKYLTSVKTDKIEPGDIKWNFEKFLVNREGEVVARFEPKTEPDSEVVLKAIEAELKKEAK
jgi:glutathione peroxidase